MTIDGGSEICVMSEEDTRELNIGWKRTDWKMITADCNRSDLMKVAQSVPVNFHCIVVSLHIILAKSGSEQVILGRRWETYARECEKDLDDGSCEITIAAIDGSELVTFVTTIPAARRDTFPSSSGNLDA